MNYPFTPLTTYSGLSINELKALIDRRDIYIWGCGHLGRALKRCFEKNGLSVKSFCDSDPKIQGEYFDGLKIVSPGVAMDLAASKQAFLIIASARYRGEIEESCIGAGLIKKEDFISYIRISRPEAAIDVTGKCNMEGLIPEGYMTAKVYKQVLNKLISELPMLMNIDLSTWGEPFMNTDLPKIIHMTEELVPCSIYTSLQISGQLEDVIKEQPSQMMISAGGYGKSYEANRAGSSWQTFHDNLHALKRLIDKYRPKTQIAVLYHLYRDNQQQDLDNMRKMCSELGLKIITTWAYLNPYDKMLDLCEGRDINAQDRKVLDALAWDLKGSLKLAQRDADNPCLCQRIFPVINRDLSVSICHIYYNPIISKNYLDTKLDEIVKERHVQKQCIMCQKHGLHRLDIEVLRRKYPDENILLKSVGGK